MQNHRDVSPSRIKPGTYCLLDTLWSHWQMTCIINLNFMNKVVLFPSPRSFSRTDSRGREIPPNCPPPASLVLCVQQASTSTRFASHVDMHCCSFSNDVCCGSNETTGKNKDKNGQRSQPADICEAAQRGV